MACCLGLGERGKSGSGRTDLGLAAEMGGNREEGISRLWVFVLLLVFRLSTLVRCASGAGWDFSELMRRHLASVPQATATVRTALHEDHI
jgi:hypothetical protein